MDNFGGTKDLCWNAALAFCVSPEAPRALCGTPFQSTGRTSFTQEVPYIYSEYNIDITHTIQYIYIYIYIYVYIYIYIYIYR